MNDINIHTIVNLQMYVQSYGLPKLSIRGLSQIYEHGLVALPGKPTPSIKYHRKEKNPYLSRYGERWLDKLKSSVSFWDSNDLMDEIELLLPSPHIGSSVGNIPEFMPLYNSLNRDIFHSLRFQCVLSRFFC